jgi:hypothetical protein
LEAIAMPIRSTACAVVLAAAFFLSPAVGTTSASAYECERQVNQVLQEHGIDQSEVKSVEIARRSGGAKSGSIYSLSAWVRLSSCTNGALMVNMTKYCMVQDVYTTGDCRVGELPSY